MSPRPRASSSSAWSLFERRGDGTLVEVNAESGEKRERDMTADELAEYRAWVDEQARIDRDGAGTVA
jgi:hypothetical protein